MAIGGLRSQRQGSGLRAWLALAGLSLLLLCAAAVLSRATPRPPVTRQAIEERGLQDASARGMSRVEKIIVYSTTAAQLRAMPHCAWLETLGRSLLVTARVALYNPCDGAAPVWVVELWGDYPPWVAEPARMIYTASGDYIRSDSGP
jgi:hypothetical protein